MIDADPAPADLDALRARYADGDALTDRELAVLEADHADAVIADRDAVHMLPADWPRQRAALAEAGRRLMRGARHVRAAAEHAA
ncbi:hypothetical protein [Rubrimonas cliftonensis]|uniref:hypothetical protein n=1 Tax=Rubrimonas cliftonensis TaxID=89524 RepID=UPI001114CB16|nr:hypothetical protein [Rubrimonas cliftonensis]